MRSGCRGRDAYPLCQGCTRKRPEAVLVEQGPDPRNLRGKGRDELRLDPAQPAASRAG